jgi:hypothetical protein
MLAFVVTVAWIMYSFFKFDEMSSLMGASSGVTMVFVFTIGFIIFAFFSVIQSNNEHYARQKPRLH